MSHSYEPQPTRPNNTAKVVLTVVLVLLGVGLLACGGIAVLGYWAVQKASQEIERAIAEQQANGFGNSSVTESQMLLQQEDYAGAVEVITDALVDSPDNALLLNQKAWILATAPDNSVRDGRQAVELATRACELTDFGNAAYVDTLAAAYAEAGEFETAVEWQQQAIDVNFDPNNDEGMSQRLLLYRAESPYREGPQGAVMPDAFDKPTEETTPKPYDSDSPADDSPMPNDPAEAPGSDEATPEKPNSTEATGAESN